MKVLLKYCNENEFGFRIQYIDIVLLDLIALELRKQKVIASSNWINELDQIAILRCFIKHHDANKLLHLDANKLLQTVFKQLKSKYQRSHFEIEAIGYSSMILTTLELQWLNRVIQTDSQSYAFHYKIIEHYTMEPICSKSKFSHLIDYIPINEQAVFYFEVDSSKSVATKILTKKINNKIIMNIENALNENLMILNTSFLVLVLLHKKVCYVLDPIEYRDRIVIEYAFLEHLNSTVTTPLAMLFEVSSMLEGKKVQQLIYSKIATTLPLPFEDCKFEASGWIISRKGKTTDKYRKTIAHACYDNKIQFELRKPEITYESILDEALANIQNNLSTIENLLCF
jgi:hypothetical protein